MVLLNAPGLTGGDVQYEIRVFSAKTLFIIAGQEIRGDPQYARHLEEIQDILRIAGRRETQHSVAGCAEDIQLLGVGHERVDVIGVRRSKRRMPVQRDGAESTLDTVRVVFPGIGRFQGVGEIGREHPATQESLSELGNKMLCV